MGAIITFWSIVILGYLWAIVELSAGEPFDAFVLFIVTFFLHMYRSAIVRLYQGEKGE